MAVRHISCIIINHPLNPLIIQDAAEANVLRQKWNLFVKKHFRKTATKKYVIATSYTNYLFVYFTIKQYSGRNVNTETTRRKGRLKSHTKRRIKSMQNTKVLHACVQC